MSVVSGAGASLHVVVVGNQKGGSGKSTLAMHIIVALLKAGKRVASFDLDLNQQTLTRYIENRRDWAEENRLGLELPNHCSMGDEAAEGLERNYDVDLARFMSHLQTLEHDRNHDFIVIDTPGGVQNLSVVAHGIADTLITPINDSLIDLDVIVAIGRKDSEPRPSKYARMVARALKARREVCGLATDWIVVRNRMGKQPSRNQRQVEGVLECIRERLGFRTVRGLSERVVYREFFAAGLTAFDPTEWRASGVKSNTSNLLARMEVRDLVEQIGLIDHQPDSERELESALSGDELESPSSDEVLLQYAGRKARALRRVETS
jgi:chromosome partitioning protein